MSDAVEVRAGCLTDISRSGKEGTGKDWFVLGLGVPSPRANRPRAGQFTAATSVRDSPGPAARMCPQDVCAMSGTVVLPLSIFCSGSPSSGCALWRRRQWAFLWRKAIAFARFRHVTEQYRRTRAWLRST